LNECASSAIDGRMRKKQKDTGKRRGRPPGPRPRPDDLEILWQVYVWMTWPQYATRSFDELARWAAMIRPEQRAADRTTLPNRLKRLHTAVAAAPARYGFPPWVSRLQVKGRRVKRPKMSGAEGAKIRAGVRALMDEASRAAREFKSQTRLPRG
jgi:hypothetical protein